MTQTNVSAAWPQTVPADYADDETLADAYRTGWNQGHGIACYNVPELGVEYLTDSCGHVTADAENIREIHESLCWDAEQSMRSYSPWEFIAAKYNAHDEGLSEACWEAYDAGIADSIFADLATYTDEDYGIEDVA